MKTKTERWCICGKIHIPTKDCLAQERRYFEMGKVWPRKSGKENKA